MAWSFTPDVDTDFQSVSAAELPAVPTDINTVYRITDTNKLAAWDPELEEYRELRFDVPVSPNYLDLGASGILDFRTLPDLTTLGIHNRAGTTVTAAGIAGEISGTLSTSDGLKLTEVKPGGWTSVLSFRKLGASTADGKTFSFISRAADVGTCYVMLGLMGLQREAENAKPYQAYSEMSTAIYYNTSSNGRIYRPYIGADDAGYFVTSLPFLNASNATAYIENLVGKWWRGTITAAGTSGAVITAVEVDPSAAASADDLFGAGVEVGPTISRTLGWNIGTTNAESCLALSMHQANGGYDLMAVKIA